MQLIQVTNELDTGIDLIHLPGARSVDHIEEVIGCIENSELFSMFYNPEELDLGEIEQMANFSAIATNLPDL